MVEFQKTTGAAIASRSENFLDIIQNRLRILNDTILSNTATLKDAADALFGFEPSAENTLSQAGLAQTINPSSYSTQISLLLDTLEADLGHLGREVNRLRQFRK